MIDVEPLPSNPTTDEWMEDSRRIKDENKSEAKIRRDMERNGGVEHCIMQSNAAAFALGLKYFG